MRVKQTGANKLKPKMGFTEAKARYVHRFTMEHVPNWVTCAVGIQDEESGDVKFYAPHYRTDLEWYENTLFPPHNPLSKSDCYSSGQTWPLGKWLDKPYQNGAGK